MFSVINESGLTRRVPILSHSDSSLNFEHKTISSINEHHLLFSVYAILVCFGILLLISLGVGVFFVIQSWRRRRNSLFRRPCPTIRQEVTLSEVDGREDPLRS